MWRAQPLFAPLKNASWVFPAGIGNLLALWIRSAKGDILNL